MRVADVDAKGRREANGEACFSGSSARPIRRDTSPAAPEAPAPTQAAGPAAVSITNSSTPQPASPPAGAAQARCRSSRRASHRRSRAPSPSARRVPERRIRPSAPTPDGGRTMRVGQLTAESAIVRGRIDQDQEVVAKAWYLSARSIPTLRLSHVPTRAPHWTQRRPRPRRSERVSSHTTRGSREPRLLAAGEAPGGAQDLPRASSRSPPCSR